MKYLSIFLLLTTSVFAQGAGDAAFHAFMSTMIMPSDQNPCVGLKQRKILFRAEDVACAAKFRPHGRKCILIYKKRKMAVNRAYCKATDFRTLSDIYPTKEEIQRVMGMKKKKFSSKR
jgi:hypothetical protein